MKNLVQVVVVSLVAWFSSLGAQGATLAIYPDRPQESRFYTNLDSAERQIFLEMAPTVAEHLSSKKVQTAQYVQLPWDVDGLGSETNALRYCAQKSEEMSLGLYQQLPGQAINYRSSVGADFSLSTIDDVNALMREKLKILVDKALTNSAVIKDQPLKVFGFTVGHNHSLTMFLDYLLISTPLSFVKAGEEYRSPDLTQYSFGLDTVLTIEFADATWFRIEATNIVNGVRQVFDTRVNTPDDATFAAASTDTHLVAYRTDIVTSGTNGPTRLKTYVGAQTSSTYVVRLYGEYGQHVDERPLVLSNLRLSGGNVLLDAVGETGRMGRLLWGPCPDGPWTGLGTDVVIRSFGQIQTVQTPVQSGNGFYQVHILDRTAPWIVD